MPVLIQILVNSTMWKNIEVKMESNTSSVGHFCTDCFLLNIGHTVTCGRLVVSSSNKTDRHDITEILLKVAINFIIKFCTSMPILIQTLVNSTMWKNIICHFT
jgi:hypothetical protein